MFKNMYDEFLVSPITQKALKKQRGFFITDDEKEKYSIINNVPVLLHKNEKSLWHRELIEAILWEYPDKISEMYSKIDWRTSPVPIYIEYINKYLGNKKEIENSLIKYSEQMSDKWIAENQTEHQITQEQRKKFKKYSSYFNGRYRVKTVKKSTHPYNYYVNKVLETKPKTILELSTGAGSGTCAVSKKKDKNTIMFTVDICFECHGNVVGINKYLHTKNTLFPVVANFWHLPFKKNTFDCVCSNCGLDESRENQLTIREVSRVLKHQGRFVNVSRKNSYMRQESVLKPFGFTNEEIDELMKKCRLYSDTQHLNKICNENKLYLVSEKNFSVYDKVFTVSVFEKH